MLTRFYKYHALGNDYLVLNPSELLGELNAFRIQRICHRHFGVGSDGILLGPLATAEADFGLRIFNPDGSEAEKSGNGLRIFSRYLWDQGLVKERPFTVMTLGGRVESTVKDEGRSVTVQMGQVSFDSTRIPVKGAPREVLNETMALEGEKLLFCAVTVGNPHCVVLREEVSEEETRRLGPPIEKDPRFPNRTNVQFMKVLDRSHVRIEIWERGAGYTLASGSSASAAAAVAYRLGLCGRAITVCMPGGELDIRISEDFSIQMTGPVTKIAEGTLSPEMLDS
jgi:diaminopimelate epimerase